MAIFYTDVALNQKLNVNFPGAPGEATMTTQPGTQNNPLLEAPPEVIATYTWAGTEAAGDIINLAVGGAGWLVKANGTVASGATAPAATLTVAIGDNDLNYASARPVVNPQAVAAQPAGYEAPLWVSGTSYVPGNVVIDANSTPANQTFTCLIAVSGSTAPHSDATKWAPASARYSTSISIAAASGNVAFATGQQQIGLPAYAPVTGTVPTGYTANQLAHSQWQLQSNCWLQALILTMSTPVAGAVSVFRLGIVASN